MRRGYTVPVVEGSFGPYLDHGVTSRQGVLVLCLPEMAGWHVVSKICLTHQIYTRSVLEWLETHPDACELVVLSVENGQKRTIWVREGERQTYP